MNNKQITVNGYTFQVMPTLEDDNSYRLCYGGAIVLDDSACEDFYGDIDTVADIMAAYIQEETEKPFPWFTLLGAIVEQGSDATKIEDDEDAKRWGEIINGGNPRELTNPEEIKDAKERLDFDDTDHVEHVYHFVNGNAGNFILEKDY